MAAENKIEPREAHEQINERKQFLYENRAHHETARRSTRSREELLRGDGRSTAVGAPSRAEENLAATVGAPRRLDVVVVRALPDLGGRR